MHENWKILFWELLVLLIKYFQSLLSRHKLGCISLLPPVWVGTNQLVSLTNSLQTLTYVNFRPEHLIVWGHSLEYLSPSKGRYRWWLFCGPSSRSEDTRWSTSTWSMAMVHKKEQPSVMQEVKLGISTIHSDKPKNPKGGLGGIDIAFIIHMTGSSDGGQPASRTTPPLVWDLF